MILALPSDAVSTTEIIRFERNENRITCDKEVRIRKEAVVEGLKKTTKILSLYSRKQAAPQIQF